MFYLLGLEIVKHAAEGCAQASVKLPQKTSQLAEGSTCSAASLHRSAQSHLSSMVTSLVTRTHTDTVRSKIAHQKTGCTAPTKTSSEQASEGLVSHSAGGDGRTRRSLADTRTDARQLEIKQVKQRRRLHSATGRAGATFIAAGRLEMKNNTFSDLPCITLKLN